MARIRSAACQLAALGILLWAASRASAGTVVYSQPPVPLGQTFTIWASDNNVSGGNSIVRDDFSLTTSVLITEVEWWGGWADVVNLVGAPSDALSWEIGFWTDAGGLPGVPIEIIPLSLADVSVTSLGTAPWRNDPAFEVFKYHANLPTGFAATAGTTYWLSIQELSAADTQDVAFGWYEKDGSNGLSWQTFNGTNFPKTDRAFALTAVPEPGSLVLIASALCPIVGFVRRRSNRAQQAA